MNWNEAVEKRIEAYLSAVEQHLAHKPAAVRKEVVEGLRDHIGESLRRMEMEGGEVGLDVVERLLAEMDPPETFEEAAMEGLAGVAAAVAPAAAKGGGGRWFWLALAFLAVNTYGVWKWTSRPVVSTPVGPVSVVDEPVLEKPVEKILRLRRVEQVDVSPDREVVLVLAFSETPDRNQLTRFFHLEAEGQGEVEYRLTGSMGSNTVMVETAPVLAEKLEYAIDAGMTSVTAGVKPLDRGSRGSLPMEMNVALKKIETDSPPFDPPTLRANFNAFPEVNGLKEYVSVSPAVSYTVEAVDDWDGRGLVLHGDFKPGAIYEVTFKEGLPAANGSSLVKTITRSIQFPLPSPAVRLESPGRYLSPRGTLSVPVSAANLQEFEARLRPVFANNLVEMARRESDWYYSENEVTRDLTGSAKTVTNLLPVAQDGNTVRGAVNLRSLAGREPRGAYWLDVWGKKARGEGRLLVVTDLGIASRVFAGGAVVWVNSLRTAQPVAGAEVTVYARNNQILAHGTTDDRGLVKMEWATGEEDDPFLVTAEAEGDLSYVDLGKGRVEQGEGLGVAEYVEAGKVEAAVFTERGVYRPGETVFVQALVRDGQQMAPESFPVVWRVRRPDGRIFQDIPVELDPLGSVQAEVMLPEFLPTGRYTFELAMPGTLTTLGETTVALEDFVPPQIRVEVKPSPERGSAGDVVLFGVRSAHLFGRAASGLKVSGAVTFKAAPFAPTNWGGWLFGDGEKEFTSEYRNLGTGTLDEEGAVSFEAESRKAWRPPAALQCVQQATVMEASGRSVTAYGNSMLDAYPFYVGLKPAWEGAVRVGATQRVAVVEVLPTGSAVEKGKALVMVLSRVTWNSVLRRNAHGRYEWKSERQVVEIRKDTLEAGGEALDWSFAVDGSGEYLLVAQDPASGASSSLSFNAGSADSEWLAWSREKPGRVELTWNKDRYGPGETALLQVRAPFAGPALLTVETDHVREMRVVTLEKNTAELEVPVEASFAPNAYCSLTLIRPATAEAVWSAHRAVGAIPLMVDRPGHELHVKVDAPAVIRPKTSLMGTVTVHDEGGNPVSGRVTVMAVDEAICMLTEFETPNPATVFKAQRYLGVNLYDLYGELMPVTEDQMEAAPAPGGDGEDGLRRRLNPIKANRFKPVALWQAAVELNTNGQAQIQMDVPEFSGELRLMAVAYTATQTGSTSTPVLVKRELIVQPAFPRFLAMGDSCRAMVALHNESGLPMSVKLRVLCGGPLQAEVADQVVQLPAGGSAQVDLPLVAGPGPGKAVCTIEAEGGEEFFRDIVELAVRPAAGSRVDAVSRVLAAGESITMEPPKDWLPVSLSMSGLLSALPSLQMGRALDYVVHYPYGCLEQTVSGAFPLLYAEEWATRMLPSSQALGDVSVWVPSAISRVLSMQQEGGGFSMWPFSRGTEKDASIYAVHFLVEAKAAGFDVPEERLKEALEWVRSRLDRTVSTQATPDEWILEMQERAYLCHVLALAGRPDAGWNARLCEQAAKLNFAARAHVAAALLLAGEPRKAMPLMGSMVLPVTRVRVPGRLLDSDVRDAALLLSAWLDIDPENEAVVRLAQYLRDRQQNGHWGNTQDDAMALLALGKLAQQLPAQEMPFAGTLTLPDGATRSFSGTNDVDWSLKPGEGGAITVKNDGPGKLYLVSRTEGVSSTPEAALDQGISIRREFLDIAGNELDPTELPQGELIVIRLTLDTHGRLLDQLVIEDLLPAGWEIENANLATSQQLPWLRQREESDRSREARDDRMLIFTAPISGERQFHYAVRAVTQGRYTLPPVVVSGMYEPEIRGVSEGGRVSVIP